MVLFVKAAAQAFRAPLVVFWPYDRGQFLHNEVVSEGMPEAVLRANPPRDSGTTQEILLQKGYVKVEYERDLPLFVGINVSSFQGVALRVAEEKLGVLYVSYLERRSFSQHDQERLETFATVASHALHRCRLDHQLKAELEVYSNVSHVMAQAPEEPRVTLRLVASGL